MPKDPDVKRPANKPEVPCPTCGKKILWSTDNPWRPFCSERCRLIDLGEWLTENMRIPDKDQPPPGSEPDDEF